jgi:hypothetical protein
MTLEQRWEVGEGRTVSQVRSVFGRRHSHGNEAASVAENNKQRYRGVGS